MENEDVTKEGYFPPSSTQLSTPVSPKGSERALRMRKLPPGDSVGQAKYTTHMEGDSDFMETSVAEGFG